MSHVELNTRLIAAAPALLAACEDQLKWLARNTPFVGPSSSEIADSMDAQRERLRKVIALATDAKATCKPAAESAS